MIKNNMDKLYDYLFHYNPYEKLWYAFKRDESHKYFNGDKKGVMKDPEIEELITSILVKNHKPNA